ncbi:MAG: holo-ACP synthase [Pseudomonadota bacterium]
MIYGIGTDIVRIARIEAALARHGKRFTDKILGPAEAAIYHRRRSTSPIRGLRFVATRFAAKEAFSKALGLGMRPPMCWHALEVVNTDTGKPQASFSGALKDYMHLHALSAQVSITDEADYAVAFVLVEKHE